MNRLVVALIVAAALLLPTLSLAAPITTPSDLVIGQQYRLAFRTLNTRDGLSTDIADYDSLVQSDAAAVPELAALGTTWRVIGSTAAVDARDHTSTTGVGVPIYLLNDTRLVDDYVDLWNGSIDIPLNVRPNGSVDPVARITFTGTNSLGVASSPLGNGGNVRWGSSGVTSASWVSAGTTGGVAYLYGLSDVLTVPEPTIPALLLLAFGALLAVTRPRAE